MGHRVGSFFSLSLCVLALSACETTGNIWSDEPSPDSITRNDSSTVAEPLMPALRQSGESLTPEIGVVAEPVAPLTPLTPLTPVSAPVDEIPPPALTPAFATPDDALMHNMNVSGDSSVTIYPLDGSMPGMSHAVTPGSAFVDGSEYYNPSSPAPIAAYTASVGVPQAQIFFKHGSARLGSEDIRKLSEVAQGASMVSGRLSVEGHASQATQTNDPVRSSILNLKESMNRAYAVSKALIQKGVPANKLKTTAYGDTKPEGDEANQRRVDVRSGGY